MSKLTPDECLNNLNAVVIPSSINFHLRYMEEITAKFRQKFHIDNTCLLICNKHTEDLKESAKVTITLEIPTKNNVNISNVDLTQGLSSMISCSTASNIYIYNTTIIYLKELNVTILAPSDGNHLLHMKSEDKFFINDITSIQNSRKIELEL